LYKTRLDRYLVNPSLKVKNVRAWIVLLSVASGAAHAQLSPEILTLSGAYADCATKAAVRLGSGFDAADVVAKGATEFCIPQLQLLADRLAKEGRSQAYINGTIESLNSNLVRKLKFLILEARSKK
jgi:hypothetical protein